MTTAGLRNVVRASSTNAQLLATVQLPGLGSQAVTTTAGAVTSVIHQDTGAYVSLAPQVSIETTQWVINNTLFDGASFLMQLYGTDISSARSHLQLLKGRLPVTNGDKIEILLSSTAATYLNVTVGSTLSFPVRFLPTPSSMAVSNSGQVIQTDSATITAQVAGIFQVSVNDTYWNGQDFEAPKPSHGIQQPPFLGLTSSAVLRQKLDELAKSVNAPAFFPSDSEMSAISLSYSLNPASLTNSKLNEVITDLGNVQKDIATDFSLSTNSLNFPYINSVTIAGPVLHEANAPSILEKFRDQMAVGQTPALILTAQIVCLILFFVSMMSGALVERQQQAIAVMRSRGASRRQVLGSLITQGVALCLLAGLAGPILATGLVLFAAPLLLPANSRDALDVLTRSPWQAIRSLANYTLIAAAATLGTMLFSLAVAVRATILTQRREEARSMSRPLWQRLRLDLVIAVLALAGYIVAFYVEDISPSLGVQSQALVSMPLELLAPLLLLLAAILFFLRLFPLLLRLLAHLTQRQSGLSSMLALAQMTRAPRQPMRMALLLGLATAFALFSLVFSASQQQRALDLAAYQTGSDFSGILTVSDLAGPLSYVPGLPQTSLSQTGTATTLAQTTAHYQQIAGVTSVTVGAVDNLFLLTNSSSSTGYARETELYAVDAGTFARTALWTTQDSSQPLSALMTQLVTQRSQAIQRQVVPAILATSTWQMLGLSPGEPFHLTDGNGNLDPITYIALTEVAHIPPVDDSSQGAILVDYTTLASARAQNQEPLLPNYAWLRSSDSPTALTHIRTILTRPTYGLLFLNDRRALITANATDPLALNLLSILSIGVATAFLLAFLANLLLPLLNIQSRGTSFAVLRALGTSPGQVVSILTWEQGTILGTALLLGLGFGALLAWAAVPSLIITTAAPTSQATFSSLSIFALQRIIPIAIVIPPSLIVALAVLVCLCLLALVLLARLAQSSLLGQALRLNED